MRFDTRAKHYIIGIDDLDTEIYRVVEVFRLFEIFESGIITFTAPKMWEDPYENFLEYSYGFYDENSDMRISYEGYSKLIFGQCWTLSEETDAIWRIYSPNRDRVKIKTTVKKIQQVLEGIEDQWFRSYVGRVKYVPESDIKKAISELISNSNKTFIIRDKLIREFYLVKRKAFQYEDEVRVIVNLPEPPQKYTNAKYQDPNNLDICRIPLSNPVQLFDEIVFDPRMPDSLVRAYTSYLKNELQFTKEIYKSKLYSKPKIRVKVEKELLSP
jgi:hypothetical protein